MPRPNQPRSIAGEQSLARRVAHEREKRGWSYDGLASRMTNAGCAIQSSAIYKIEKSNPPRRITVDELIGFAEVFGVPAQELLLPPEAAATKELAELMMAWNYAREEAARARSEEESAWASVQRYLANNPEAEGALEPIVRTWVDFYVADDSDREAAFIGKMAQLTKSDAWVAKWRDHWSE